MEEVNVQSFLWNRVGDRARVACTKERGMEAPVRFLVLLDHKFLGIGKLQ